MSHQRTQDRQQKLTGQLKLAVRDPEPGYHLRRPLGRGGFGEVWEADSPSGTPVALKFMPFTDTLSAARELRAIQMIGGLEHPNLIRVEKVWGLPHSLAVAMELAEGSLLDLFEASRESGVTIPNEDFLSYLSQVAGVLDFLNTRQHQFNGLRVGIQHCDIKPSNLLLCGETVKLCDFGLATTTTGPLRLHRKIGTRQFMAPEVRQGCVSERTDQYSLALTYCLLRGGRLPFADQTANACALDLTMLPPPEQRVVGRALAVQPDRRWPSCELFLGALAGVMAASSCVPQAGYYAPQTMPATGTEENSGSA